MTSDGDHLSHTTPWPSLALATIKVGKPFLPPLLPCTQVSPTAWAALINDN